MAYLAGSTVDIGAEYTGSHVCADRPRGGADASTLGTRGKACAVEEGFDFWTEARSGLRYNSNAVHVEQAILGIK